MAISPEATEAAADLRRLTSMLRHRLMAVTRDDALSLAQSDVLVRVDREGPATLSELAAGERVRPQSMAATLDALTAAGLVERTPHPTDRRSTVVSLSAHGHATLEKARGSRQEWLSRALADELDAEELRVVIRATGLIERVLSR
jgi:DNA-binding MarR family transcriptional regulator